MYLGVRMPTDEGASLEASVRVWRQQFRLEEMLGELHRPDTPDEVAEWLDLGERLRAGYTALAEAKDIARALVVHEQAERILSQRKRKPSPGRRVASAELRALKLAGVIVQMYEDQQGQCAYCLGPLRGVYHVDHKVPVSRGGKTIRDNLCCACPKCNLEKHDMTAEEFRTNRPYAGVKT